MTYKVCDLNLTIEQGGVKILKYAPFAHEYRQFIKVAKKKGICFKTPLSQFDSSFFTFLLEGEQSFCGLSQLYLYLESKKYKKNVRIYIRSLQSELTCQSCNGFRLNSNALSRAIGVNGNIKTIAEVLSLSYAEMLNHFQSLPEATDIKEILKIVTKLGLDNVALFKKVKDLTPSEYQRLLLIKYLSYRGTGALFVFDEPTLGLDHSEQVILLECLNELCALGNTLVLVDHAPYFEARIPYQVEFGPKAGKSGGEVVFMGQHKTKETKTNDQ
jgi:excinuclease ABC subunit A